MTTNDIDSLSDTQAKGLLLETAHALHAKIALDLDALRTDDWSDDDTDYFPARAETLQYAISALANVDQTPLEALREFISHAEEMGYWTCDLPLPLDNLMLPQD